MVPIRVVVMSHGEGLALPAYETALSAGCDVRAAVDDIYVLDPGARYPVPTGLKLAIPAGFEIQVRARSGLAFKHGIGLPNAPGTIDADYRGELKILLCNWGQHPFTIRRGDRIAQLIVAPVVQARFQVVPDLDETARGDGGFGSTGV